NLDRDGDGIACESLTPEEPEVPETPEEPKPRKFTCEEQMYFVGYPWDIAKEACNPQQEQGPPPTPPAPSSAPLPATGSSVGWWAVGGVSAIILGLAFWRWSGWNRR